MRREEAKLCAVLFGPRVFAPLSVSPSNERAKDYPAKAPSITQASLPPILTQIGILITSNGTIVEHKAGHSAAPSQADHMDVTAAMLLDNQRVKRGTLVRALAPVGIYWRESFTSPSAIYSPDEKLVYIATHFDESLHEGDYYTEFDDPTLEEVRLLAALSLPIGWDGGVVSLYPFYPELRIPSFLDLADPKVDGELRTRLAGMEPERQGFWHADPPPPPLHGGQPYDFRNSATPSELQKQIFSNIDLDDHLLLRGLSAWLKAGMLRHHRPFAVEALFSMYVSLDASFSLVCRELRKRGVPNPSAVDAGRFLDEAEGREPEGMPYFGEFYSDRIRLMHPENRFGVTPYPPAMNGDLAHLNLALREVYRLLLLGATVDPHNYIDFEDPDRAADTPTPDQF